MRRGSVAVAKDPEHNRPESTRRRSSTRRESMRKEGSEGSEHGQDMYHRVVKKDENIQVVKLGPADVQVQVAGSAASPTSPQEPQSAKRASS